MRRSWELILDYWIALIVIQILSYFLNWYIPLWIDFAFMMVGVFLTIGNMIYGFYLENKNGVW